MHPHVPETSVMRSVSVPPLVMRRSLITGEEVWSSPKSNALPPSITSFGWALETIAARSVRAAIRTSSPGAGLFLADERKDADVEFLLAFVVRHHLDLA